MALQAASIKAADDQAEEEEEEYDNCIEEEEELLVDNKDQQQHNLCNYHKYNNSYNIYYSSTDNSTSVSTSTNNNSNSNSEQEDYDPHSSSSSDREKNIVNISRDELVAEEEEEEEEAVGAENMDADSNPCYELHSCSSETQPVAINTTATTKARRKYVLSAVARERRNRRRRLYSVLPRGLKRDIRREYMTVFMNVLNSFDEMFLMSALDTFCTPNCLMVNFIPAITFHGISPVVQFDNHQYMAQYWAMNGQFVPDLTISCNDTRLLLPQDSAHSRLVSRVVFRGSQIYYPPNHSVDQMLKQLLNIQGVKLMSKDDGFYFEQPELNKYLTFDEEWLAYKTLNMPAPLSVAIPLHFEATVTFFMDDNNYIYKMEFIGNEVNKEIPS